MSEWKRKIICKPSTVFFGSSDNLLEVYLTSMIRQVPGVQKTFKSEIWRFAVSNHWEDGPFSPSNGEKVATAWWFLLHYIIFIRSRFWFGMHILIFGRDNTYGWCCIASPVRLLGRKDIDLHRNTRCFFVFVQEFVCIHCFFWGNVFIYVFIFTHRCSSQHTPAGRTFQLKHVTTCWKDSQILRNH